MSYLFVTVQYNVKLMDRLLHTICKVLMGDNIIFTIFMYVDHHLWHDGCEYDILYFPKIIS